MKKLAQIFFKYRSYTPIPFVLLMIAFHDATLISMIIGFIMLLVGESFRLWGVSVAGSETRTTGGVGGSFLVVSGAYSHLRNPLYLGNILIYLGIGVMSMSLFPYLQFVALLFFLLQYQLIITEEEEFLTQKFGESYKQFKKNVPSLIPSIRAFKNPGIEQPEYDITKGLRSEKRSLQAILIVVLIIILQFLVKAI
ncbi:protein-S-isoprenylcysteine methyltransferase [bacterium BRH_c32]|nr:MAG: protein-S-isoprenylcysteine methyltransferase [bacterium BRH_c32]